MKKTLHLLFAFIWVAQLFAQKAESPDYSYELGAKINEMTLTQGGTFVVATNDGLVGILPGKNEILFNFTEYGRVKPEELFFVPDAPYVIVSQGGFANLTSKKAVIDYISGKTLFSTENNGWKLANRVEVMMPQNKLFVAGQRTSKEKYAQQVAIYDLGTGKEDYRFNLDEPGRVGVAKVYEVTGVPALLKNELIIPTNYGIVAKKAQTGDVLWENKIKNVSWIVVDKDEKEMYAFETNMQGTNTEIYKLNIANGNEIWKDAQKVKGQVSNFEILPQGLAVVSDKGLGSDSGVFSQKEESEIAMLSATTGEDLWEKAPKTKGYVQHFYIMKDGILFGIQQGGINKISFDGKPLYKKPLKTGENILVMANTPQGLIYITSEDANIVNLETGEEVWAKPLKYKKAESVASTFDSKNNRYLISADENIIAVDANTGNISEFGKIDFDEKEQPNTLQIRESGVFLASSQNMTLLDQNGGKIYHNYYKSPSRSTFAKIMGGIVAVASTAMAATYAAKAGANKNYLGDYNQYGREYDRASKMFSAIGTASFNYISERFKATAATENAQFILTKLDDGVGLVKVNKDSGKVEKEIILKDKKPEYEVDDFGGMLYYKAKDDVIYAYDLKK